MIDRPSLQLDIMHHTSSIMLYAMHACVAVVVCVCARGKGAGMCVQMCSVVFVYLGGGIHDKLSLAYRFHRFRSVYVFSGIEFRF